MASVTKEYHYPQTYFLEPEALIHFGIKARSYKRWLDEGTEIPGRYKVKGSNYYVIEPHQFHLWLIDTKIEPATKHNKLHDGRKKNHVKGGKPTSDVVPDGLNNFPSGANKPNGLTR